MVFFILLVSIYILLHGTYKDVNQLRFLVQRFRFEVLLTTFNLYWQTQSAMHADLTVNPSPPWAVCF